MILRIRELDGWRGISIGLVVACHWLNIRCGLHGAAEKAAAVLAAWGVDIFFIASGFIITRLAIDERQREGRFSVRRFYIRRAFRILPPLFIYLIAIAVLTLAGAIDQPITGLAKAATFTCNFSSCGWFALHSWSLAYEEQFYLAFPLVILPVACRRRGGLLVLWLGLALAPMLGYALSLDGAVRHAVRLSPPFCYILAGATLAAYQTQVGEFALRAPRVIGFSSASILTILLGIQIFADFTLGSPWSRLQALTTTLAQPIALAAAVSLSLWTPNAMVVRRVLLSRALQALGAISYSLYLWQQAFTGASEHYAERSWLFAGPLMLVPAIASYFLVERPANAFGHRIAAGRASKPEKKLYPLVSTAP